VWLAGLIFYFFKEKNDEDFFWLGIGDPGFIGSNCGTSDSAGVCLPMFNWPGTRLTQHQPGIVFTWPRQARV
jgi:hypothetical protein